MNFLAPLSFKRSRTAKRSDPIELTYELDGETLPVFIKTHARAQRLTMRLGKAGGISVTVPAHMRHARHHHEILQFVSRHQNWLRKQFSKKPQQLQIVHGALLPIGGVEHEVLLQDGRGSTYVRDMQDGPKLFVFGDAAHMKRRVKDYLKRQARARLEPLSIQYAAQLGCRPASVQFKDTTSRWGSCSSNRTLSYSWRVAMAPIEVQDYLVAHEVSHLREMNHGPQFWSHVEDLCPAFDQHRTWLKVYGAKLHAWNFS